MTFSYQSLSILISVLLLLSYIGYQRFFSPLARIPGPFLASLTSWWLVSQTRTERYHRISIDLHKKYGPIVRTSPNQVSVSTAQSVRQVYPISTTAWPKSNWYRVWRGPRKLDLFAGQDQKAHKQQRKFVARAYSTETLKDLEPYVDNCLQMLMQQFDKRVGQRVDMAKWVHLFSFDVVGEITWSANFGYVAAGKDDGIFASIQTLGRSGSWLGHVPYVYYVHELLKPLVGNWLGVGERHGTLRDFAIRETARRRQNPGGKRDLVSRFFESHEKQPQDFTYADVISMGTAQVSAGSDTTAASINAIIYYVLKTQSVKSKLVAEIDEAWMKGELSNPVRQDEAVKLLYLQAVINEGLRIHPAFGMDLPRVVPAEGATIEDYYLPAGTVVGMNAWAVQRDATVYGHDTESFRPERWLEGDTSDMFRYFLTFGAGSRICLGRNIAFQEISKLITTLFLNYDLTLADPDRDWTEKCYLFVGQSNMDVIMNRRLDFCKDKA